MLLLNRELLKKAGDQWTDEAVRTRTRALADIILEIRPAPPNHRSGFIADRPRLRKRALRSDLVIGGILEPGMPLFPRRKKYSARVATLLPDGQVEVDGKAYASPSHAASASLGRANTLFGSSLNP